MLQVQNLSVSYGQASALHKVSMEVNEGEIVAVIGPNGAGKTTLLNTITGLLKAKEGTILYKDNVISGTPAHKILGFGISHVPQGRQVFGDQSVEDNLILGAFSIKKEKQKIQELIEREYERFPRLKERRWQQAGTLSGGEQQMLAVSRALMSDPDFVILDEPSMGLSPIFVKQIFDTLIELKKAGKTVMVVEQLAMAALAISDRAYVLQVGEVKLHGQSRDLLRDNSLVKTYLGSATAN
ncbi:ABC transporter ATP-binding protein [Sporosarcina sp. ACRSL]|uniref:ABC transporter ATP-binding protein n=1 Tax=Sporosarcina sp. ACRSL TaxID=2918215 RepID=UPI001EF6B5DB|nr:ABC transporter ATP-binding protein [Sporosarcina sp. ACRSL]MCG7345669.1 ABC transporter ATP-binding protein [Sporosarcina sp. ACRSL]